MLDFSPLREDLRLLIGDWSFCRLPNEDLSVRALKGNTSPSAAFSLALCKPLKENSQSDSRASVCGAVHTGGDKTTRTPPWLRFPLTLNVFSLLIKQRICCSSIVAFQALRAMNEMDFALVIL